MKRLTNLEQLSEHVEFFPETYPVPGEDETIQFRANANLEVSDTGASDWPIAVNVNFDVTARLGQQQDGNAESDDDYERLFHIELMLRCQFDDNVIDSDTQRDEARAAIWPYCRERLMRVIRDFPVKVPELPYHF